MSPNILALTFDYEQSKILIHQDEIEMAYFLSKLMGINDSLIIKEINESKVTETFVHNDVPNGLIISVLLQRGCTTKFEEVYRRVTNSPVLVVFALTPELS